jgi:hypothetical protein
VRVDRLTVAASQAYALLESLVDGLLDLRIQPTLGKVEVRACIVGEPRIGLGEFLLRLLKCSRRLLAEPKETPSGGESQTNCP